MVGLDQPGLSRIENNKQRVRHTGVFFRFVEGLGIPIELVLPPALREDGAPVKRRDMLRTAALSAATGDASGRLATLARQAGEEGGTCVGESDLADLRATIDDLYRLDARVGGDQLWRLALAQLRTVEIFLERFSYTEKVGHELNRIMGELRTSVGWYSFDADRQESARNHLSEALNLAYLTDDHMLVGRTLANMARQAIHLGRPKEAVQLSQRGTERSGRFVTPRVRALLAIREAQGWAGMEQTRSAEDAIRRAHVEFDLGPSDRDPEWLAFLNEAELSGLEGMTRTALGQHQSAETLHKRSIALRAKDGYRRNLNIGLIYLSRNSLMRNDLEHAGRMAERAAGLAGEITSARVRAELRTLAGQLAPHRAEPAIAQALNRLSQGNGWSRGVR